MITRDNLRPLSVALMCLMGATHIPIALADDTEIFIATPTGATNTRPNILFVIDTSGSMDTLVVDKEPYKPSTPYSGSCSTARVYWKTSGSSGTPSCGTDQWVSQANFVCQTAQTQLNASGTWPIGPAAQWRTSKKLGNRWDKLSPGQDSYIECQTDTTIGHGLVAGDNKYAADSSNGPFSTNSSQSITWTGNAGNTYIFYSGNYLNWYHNAPSTNLGTRLQIVQNVTKSTLDRLSNVNVGLMRFSSDADGGMVLYPMTPVETARDPIKIIVENFDGNGGTPLSETMMEAYRYWSGGSVHYGLDSITGSTSNPTPTPSVLESRLVGDTSRYKTPLGNSCQKNFIVYLTDGDPTVDRNAESDIEALPNFSTLAGVADGQCTDNGALGTEGGGATYGDGRCLDDLAKYMYQKDFYDDPAADSSTEPKENIRTYTIGFGNGVSARGLALLQTTATVGGGAFYEAGNTASLTEAFNNIISEVLEDNVSFTAPTVSVNAFNRTQNLNDLFITVFKPASTYHWPGNLKKYRLDPDGTIRDSSAPDPIVAVDENTGFFDEDARSFWSTVDDGADVELGGAANVNVLPNIDSRDVFTDIAALSGGADDLDDTRNAFADANTLIDAPMLGIDTSAMTTTEEAAARTRLIDWTRGKDVDDLDEDGITDEQRYTMGDPLHGRPVSVIYGGTADAPDAAVFAVTNDGFLHAIDPDDGSELWSFIPSELLGRLDDLYENQPSNVKRYGLDGNLVTYRKDVDNDGVIESGDKVLLFFGMGRGGYNYYALDVTDKDNPMFLWRRGRDDALIGLAQTWSTPVITRVNIAGAMQNSDKLVAIFGGGYDPTQDAIPYNTDDTGNRIFMVDAISGDLLWRAGPSSGFGYDADANFKHPLLNNSIPADVRILDMSGDGFADRMYAADTGGRIWRFDIFNGQNVSNLVLGGVFASLGVADGTGTSPQDARRFYYAPDVSLLRTNGQLVLNIAIGSGYRGHPLNTEIRDRFYSLRDGRAFTQMSSTEYSAMVAITDSSGTLVDVTTDVTPTIGTTAVGWKMDLRLPSWQGEKVLAEARTFGGSVIFTTFTPVGNDVSRSCTAQAGTNAIYIVNALDGRPVRDSNADGSVEADDRRARLEQSGIAPSAVVLFPTPDPDCVGEECRPPPVCLVGVEQCGVNFTNNPVRTFWNQQNIDAN